MTPPPEDQDIATEVQPDPGLDVPVREALKDGDKRKLRKLVKPLHPAEIADILERLPSEDRSAFLDIIGDTFHPEILPELDDAVREDVIDGLSVKNVAAAVAEMDTDDAVHVIEELPEQNQQEILENIPALDRTLIEEALSYPEETAGRMMQRELVAIPQHWTVGDTIDFLREEEERLPQHFFDVFVVDPMRKVIGAIPLSAILRTKRPVPVTDLMQTEIKRINVNMPQEEVAFVFRQRDLTSAPVEDEDGRLVGAITIDDVVDVIDEEHEDDIMRLGGVREDDLYSAVFETTKLRFTWLFINLGTAILASVVIGFFEATLEKKIALAVLMPIVASMGGNAGTQTLTVVVRALATREITATNAFRLLRKETTVGGLNGLLFAIIAAVATWVWFGTPDVSLVIALAMIINLVIAGVFGSAIPVVLQRMGLDPAVSSPIFLTTATDVFGFLAFLGLAALIVT